MTSGERKPIDGSFNINLIDSFALVKRSFEYAGANISFEIQMNVTGEEETVTLMDLHKRSIEEVIALLKKSLPQKE